MRARKPRNGSTVEPATDDPLDRRLALIEGQVIGVRKMRRADRDCVEIINQIAAIRGGLSQVALEVLIHHAEDCSAGGGCRVGEGEPTASIPVEDLRTAFNRLLK